MWKLSHREQVRKVASYLQAMYMEGCEGVLFKNKSYYTYFSTSLRLDLQNYLRCDLRNSKK